MKVAAKNFSKQNQEQQGGCGNLNQKSIIQEAFFKQEKKKKKRQSNVGHSPPPKIKVFFSVSLSCATQCFCKQK